MNLSGLIGADAAELDARLGTPDARREIGTEVWLVYRRPEATLRVRCVGAGAAAAGTDRTAPAAAAPEAAAAGGGAPRDDREAGTTGRVASWTVTWDEPRPTLRAAVEPLGLWPSCAPDLDAAGPECRDRTLVRRALPDPSGPGDHSLTAGLVEGGFDRVAVFDEAPEWT